MKFTLKNGTITSPIGTFTKVPSSASRAGDQTAASSVSAQEFVDDSGGFRGTLVEEQVPAAVEGPQRRTGDLPREDARILVAA